ncbi:9717_t:CDS:2 [Diversispora eburnea]|uniref:9717_t:CDS:1 n=1 Tax=Diversispora eburnea TaxID=1213867 RepID=A0A9N8V1U3_9GLOM|nr:9717_t:CDS:2 [Diversispora eburnea]
MPFWKKFKKNKIPHYVPHSISIVDFETQSDMINHLPVELIKQIFNYLVESIEPIDSLKVWRNYFYLPEHDDSAYYPKERLIAIEKQKSILRMTCGRWNAILLGLLNEINIDIISDFRPTNLQRLTIVNNGQSKAVQSRLDDLFMEKEFFHLNNLSINGCSDLTIKGLMNLPKQLTELKITNCPQITTQDIIILMMKNLKNLKHLMINTNQIFLDDSLFTAIQENLLNLCKLTILIPCEFKTEDLEIQLRKFPNHITELVLSYDSPQNIHYPLTMKDYERMKPIDDDGNTLNQQQVIILDSTDLYPKSMTRLDISRCLFKNNVFALPNTLTHLTVSYPTLPENHENIKLPSTLEYLNISGFIYHISYESESIHQYLNYGEQWIQMLPLNAPSLHTLILHLYTHTPKNLFSYIKSRYAQSLKFLDICICYSPVIEIETCNCEDKNLLGQCCRRSMIQSLINLTELRIHNQVTDGDFENLPNSLKTFCLYSHFEEHISKSILENIKKDDIIQLKTIPQGLFDCSESTTTECICSWFITGKSCL